MNAATRVRLTKTERSVLRVIANQVPRSVKGAATVAGVMHSLYGRGSILKPSQYRRRHSTVSQAIASLEHAGLIESVAGWCWTGVRLTESGRAVLGESR